MKNISLTLKESLIGSLKRLKGTVFNFCNKKKIFL